MLSQILTNCWRVSSKIAWSLWSLCVESWFEAEADKGSSDPAKSSVFGAAFAKLKAKAEVPLGKPLLSLVGHLACQEQANGWSIISIHKS